MRQPARVRRWSIVIKDMILIGFGSNTPFCGLAPSALVEGAARCLNAHFPVTVISRLYDSPAWPDPSDPRYVNAVARLDADAAPRTLLAALMRIERAFGRTRSAQNAPRTLDLDLLAIDDRVVRASDLPLPHPRLHQRAFVLAPLLEVAPRWRHPTLEVEVGALYERLAVKDAAPLDEAAHCGAQPNALPLRRVPARG